MKRLFLMAAQISLEKVPKASGPFFRRILALIIDFIILGIIGIGLGAILSSEFAQLGKNGVLVGWFISTIYFGFSNSQISSGQTTGKKVLSLLVVKYDGSELSIKEGFIRSLLFTTPYFLLEYFQHLALTPQIVSFSLTVITIGYYIGLIYFFIVNSADRRTIHDFFTKTLVINQNHDVSDIRKLSHLKIYIYAGIVALFFGSLLTGYIIFNSQSKFTEVVEANRYFLEQMAIEINDLDEVIWIESSKINISVDSEVGIVVEAWIKHNVNQVNCEDIYGQIVDIIAEKSFNLSRIDYSEIILNYGYDIGIANFKTSKSWKLEYED